MMVPWLIIPIILPLPLKASRRDCIFHVLMIIVFQFHVRIYALTIIV